jgi:hypothetical protein
MYGIVSSLTGCPLHDRHTCETAFESVPS